MKIETPVDRGPWTARVARGPSRGRSALVVYLDSDDFEHDAMLVVQGDFASHAHKLAYAKEIARRLNLRKEPKR